MRVDNRADLRRYLEDVMRFAYESLYERGGLEYERNLVKSYLVEAHTGTEATSDPDGVRRFVANAVRGVRGRVESTEDDSLLRITGPDVEGYLDILDRRYWIFHTASRASETDRFVERSLTWSRGLDRAWLTTELLLQLAELGGLRGFNVHFNWPPYEIDTTGLTEDQIGDVTRFGDAVYLRIRSIRAATVLDELMELQHFRRSRAVSSVKVKMFGNHGAEPVIIDLTSSGKATVKGMSFDAYLDFLLKARDTYAAHVHELEEASIRYCRPSDSPDGFGIDGHPFLFTLDPPVRNFREFVSTLVANSEPYRLAGVPRYLSDEFAHVYAVDLHTAAPLGLEIAPHFVRAYLPQGSCGNVITRLHTNLQMNLTAGTSLVA